MKHKLIKPNKAGKMLADVSSLAADMTIQTVAPVFVAVFAVFLIPFFIVKLMAHRTS